MSDLQVQSKLVTDMINQLLQDLHNDVKVDTYARLLEITKEASILYTESVDVPQESPEPKEPVSLNKIF